MENNTLITTNDVKKLKNVELKKSLLIMLNAVESGKKAVWRYAKAVSDVIAKETFAEDFGTKEAFAKFVGLSKASITNYTAAVDFAGTANAKALFGDVPMNMTVGKAYLLSKLTDDQLEEVQKFIEENIPGGIKNMSDKALRDVINNLLSPKIEKNSEPTEATEEEPTEATEEEPTEATEEEPTESAEEEPTESAEEEHTEEAEEKALEITADIDDTGKYLTFVVRYKGNVKERSIFLDADIIDFIKYAKKDIEESLK